MGKMATSVVNGWLDSTFGSGSPATIYVGLSTTTPTVTGTNVTEPSGNAYARVAVTNNATNFPAAASRAKSNGTVITFPEATGSWGTPVSAVFYDASSGGNYLGEGTISGAGAITAGTTPRIPTGDLDITLAAS